MVVFLNDRFVPEEEAKVSVFDRSFLYGDGLFETVPILNGKPFRWRQHLERLNCGAAFLRINFPARRELPAIVEELIARNALPDCLARITLSRGIGKRGYSPKGADQPALVISLHDVGLRNGRSGMVGWKLRTSCYRLPANDPLSQFKTCNKLPQILARAEAEAAGGDEALLANTDGHLVEGSSSNLFWIADGRVCTPPLAAGVLPGITRSVVLELCRAHGFPTKESCVTAQNILHSEGVFVSLSSLGVVAGISVDGQPVAQSPWTQTIQTAYWRLVEDESR